MCLSSKVASYLWKTYFSKCIIQSARYPRLHTDLWTQHFALYKWCAFLCTTYILHTTIIVLFIQNKTVPPILAARFDSRVLKTDIHSGRMNILRSLKSVENEVYLCIKEISHGLNCCDTIEWRAWLSMDCCVLSRSPHSSLSRTYPQSALLSYVVLFTYDRIKCNTIS